MLPSHVPWTDSSPCGSTVCVSVYTCTCVHAHMCAQPPHCPDIKLHHWVADSHRVCCTFDITFLVTAAWQSFTIQVVSECCPHLKGLLSLPPKRTAVTWLPLWWELSLTHQYLMCLSEALHQSKKKPWKVILWTNAWMKCFLAFYQLFFIHRN